MVAAELDIIQSACPALQGRGNKMEGPLAGVRVLEVANWLAAPAGCALLADFGADVMKVEPAAGDPYRGYRPRTADYDLDVNVAFVPCRGGDRC